MLDTGGHATVLDVASAKALGLDITYASPEFKVGTYYSPGYNSRPYAGAVIGPVPIRFNAEVELCVPYIKLIESNNPVVLLDADVLAGGRACGWDFAGIPIEVDSKGNSVGWITFRSCDKKSTSRARLVNVPQIQPHVPPLGSQPIATTVTAGDNVLGATDEASGMDRWR